MQFGAELADPLVNVRDVVETFRSYRLTPPDWRDSLEHAVAALDRLPVDEGLDADISHLVDQLRNLLDHGLLREPGTVDEVGDRVAALLSQVRVPGIPLPSEDNWEFPEVRR
jgi:hypothetical protein